MKRNGSTRAWRKVRERVLARDGHVCYLCGQHATHVDHVVARSKGGSDDEDNLAATCQACNLSKGNKTITQTNTDFFILRRDTPPSMFSLSPLNRLTPKTNRLSTETAFKRPE
jgi:5-methylcytosine-specific restriction endonuclease McrA